MPCPDKFALIYIAAMGAIFVIGSVVIAIKNGVAS